MRYIPIIAVLGLVTSVTTGCASFNSGKVDFRRAEELSSADVERLRAAHLSDCWPNDGVSARYGRISQRYQRSLCTAMLPTTLSDKNFGSPADAIKVNDVYSIRLDFGRIETLGETFGNVRLGSLQSGKPFQQQGEIAVLVNAFEFAAQGNDAANGRRFYNLGQNVPRSTSDGQTTTGGATSAPEYSSARVVYFSPDVLKGQSLNLSNIPITAPQKYEGRPIGIQIIVIELDRLSDSTKSLMKGLAELGRTTVGASETTSTLLSLGKSLLDGSHDDVVFEYRFVMDNAATLNEQVVSPFNSGRYVFRRSENRNNNLIWNRLRLDQNTGELMVLDPENKDKAATYKPYTAETFFTVSVINHGPNGVVASYENATWSEASSRFDAFLNAQTGPDVLNSQVTELVNTRQSLAALTTISESILSVANSWKALSLKASGVEGVFDQTKLQDFPAAGSSPDATTLQTQCRQNWDEKRLSAELALQDAEAATFALSRLWAASNAMSDREGDVAIERFRTGLNLALGPEIATDRIFAVPSTFKSTFISASDGPQKLAAKLLARANARRPTLSCAALAR